MMPLIVAFLLAFLIPILVGSWRVGFVGLALQGSLLAAMTPYISVEYDLATVLQVLDLAVVRGMIVPVILISTIKKLDIAPEFDFVPANFLYWAALFLIVGSGLWFGHAVFPDDLQKAVHCGAAAGGVAGSFFILSLQSAGLGQLFAILLLENSILLFEFLSPHHQQSYLIQIGVSILFLILILVVRIFLKQLPDLASTDAGNEDQGMDLI